MQTERLGSRRAAELDDPWGFGSADGTLVASEGPLIEVRLDRAVPAEVPAAAPPWPPANGLRLAEPSAAPSSARPAPPVDQLIPAVPPQPVAPTRPVADPDAFRPRHRRRAGRAATAVAAVVLSGTAGWALVRWLGAAEPPVAGLAGAGTFVLSSQPPGAQVVVDGKPAGVTPLALSLAPGPHDVVATAATGISERISAHVEAGQSSSRHVMLEPPPAAATGALSIRGAAGAEVLIDGARAGVAPLYVPALAPGEHVVQLRSPAGTSRRRVVIAAGATASLVFTPTPPPVADGWVNFSLPFEAQIYEGGSFLGLSSAERIHARPGSHTFTLVNDQLGFKAVETVTIEPGRVTARAVDPGTGTLSVNALPWCEVFIAGRSFGETPLANISLPLGVHQVTLRHPTLGERVVPVTVRRGEANRLSADLRK